MLGFGKHAGKTIAQILEEDPEYIQWLSRKELVDKKAILAFKFNVDVCIFGNLCGLTWDEIMEKVKDHPEFPRWKDRADFKIAWMNGKFDNY